MPLQFSGHQFALWPQLSDGSKKSLLICTLLSFYLWGWEWQLPGCSHVRDWTWLSLLFRLDVRLSLSFLVGECGVKSVICLWYENGKLGWRRDNKREPARCLDFCQVRMRTATGLTMGIWVPTATQQQRRDQKQLIEAPYSIKSYSKLSRPKLILESNTVWNILRAQGWTDTQPVNHRASSMG